MAMLLKGAPVAAHLSEKLEARAKALLEKGINPCLAIVRMGEKAGDLAYEHAAVSRCARLGIAVRIEALSESAEQSELLEAIKKINTDSSIHGCIIMRPVSSPATGMAFTPVPRRPALKCWTTTAMI